MTDLQLLLALLGIALLIDLIGFVRTVWFVSLGYTACIAAFVLVVGISRGASLSPAAWVMNAAAFVWAARLGGYLFKRERQATYRAAVGEETDASDALPFLVRAAIWVGVSALYVCMYAPVFFVSTTAVPTDLGSLIALISGVIVMWGGVILEGLADHQKSRFKRADPAAFVHKGLFAWVRYPNYLGEILVWTGALVAAAPVLTAWWQWAMAAVGWVCIVLIMIGSAKRLEAKQGKRYGTEPGFRSYTERVPVLFPGVPVYSLQGVRLTLG